MSKVRYPKEVELLSVDEPIIGKLYHTSWGYSRGVVGKCVSINPFKKTVILETPKTKKKFAYPVNWTALRHTRAEQTRILQQRKDSKHEEIK